MVDYKNCLCQNLKKLKREGNSMANKAELFDAVCAYMNEQKWRYEHNEEKTMIRSMVKVQCKLQTVRILIAFGETEFAVFGIPNINADDATKATVMEYITKVNLGMRNGNFLLNPANGEVRYRTYVNARGMNEISKEVIAEAILVPAMMLDRYGNGLAALMMGYSSPDAEIENAHKPLGNPS